MQMQKSAFDQKRDEAIMKCADTLLSVISLAQANFPGNTDIRISTESSSPHHAAMSVNSFALRRLIEAGRAALSRAGE